MENDLSPKYRPRDKVQHVLLPGVELEISDYFAVLVEQVDPTIPGEQVPVQSIVPAYELAYKHAKFIWKSPFGHETDRFGEEVLEPYVESL